MQLLVINNPEVRVLSSIKPTINDGKKPNNNNDDGDV